MVSYLKWYVVYIPVLLTYVGYHLINTPCITIRCLEGFIYIINGKLIVSSMPALGLDQGLFFITSKLKMMFPNFNENLLTILSWL